MTRPDWPPGMIREKISVPFGGLISLAPDPWGARTLGERACARWLRVCYAQSGRPNLPGSRNYRDEVPNDFQPPSHPQLRPRAALGPSPCPPDRGPVGRHACGRRRAPISARIPHGADLFGATLEEAGQAAKTTDPTHRAHADSSLLALDTLIRSTRYFIRNLGQGVSRGGTGPERLGFRWSQHPNSRRFLHRKGFCSAAPVGNKRPRLASPTIPPSLTQQG